MGIDMRRTMVIIMMLFLFAMFLKTLSEPSSIDGYSVLGEQVNTQKTTFGMIALLGVIFAFFVIFLMTVLRRLDSR